MVIEDKFSSGHMKLKVVAEHWGQDIQKFLGNTGVDFITTELSSRDTDYSVEVEDIVWEVINRKEIQKKNLENASTEGLKVQWAKMVD